MFNPCREAGAAELLYHEPVGFKIFVNLFYYIKRPVRMYKPPFIYSHIHFANIILQLAEIVNTQLKNFFKYF